MPEITKEAILSELKKRLDTPCGVLTADLLRERLGVPKDHTTDDWLFFYKELAYCIEGGLIKFFYDFDMKEFKESFQQYIDVNFYLNHLANKLILITPEGELWLSQQTINKELQSVKKSVDATTLSVKTLDKRSLYIGLAIISVAVITLIAIVLHL